MQRLAALVIASTLVLAVPGADARQQFVCLDRDGAQVLQPEPCSEINVEFRAKDVPAYVWGIVAVLGLAWLFVLMPERLRPWRWQPAEPIPDLAWTSPEPVLAPAATARVEVLSPRPVAVATRPRGWSLESIARLSPARFDELVQGLWQANGYKAVATGTDVKIHSAASGNLFAVARRLAAPGEPVPATAVEGLWHQVQQAGVGLGICYGLAGFATDALMFAQGKRLKLVSGAELLAQLRALRPEQQQAMLDHVWRTPAAPSPQ